MLGKEDSKNLSRNKTDSPFKLDALGPLEFWVREIIEQMQVFDPHSASKKDMVAQVNVWRHNMDLIYSLIGELIESTRDISEGS